MRCTSTLYTYEVAILNSFYSTFIRSHLIYEHLILKMFEYWKQSHQLIKYSLQYSIRCKYLSVGSDVTNPRNSLF